MKDYKIESFLNIAFLENEINPEILYLAALYREEGALSVMAKIGRIELDYQRGIGEIIKTQKKITGYINQIEWWVTAIEWPGAPFPKNAKEVNNWFEGVRRYASQFRSGRFKGVFKGFYSYSRETPPIDLAF